jgi:hypothetical protein
VLSEIRAEPNFSLMLSGTGSLLALIGAAMLDRMGEAPQGKASVSVEVGDGTQVVIKWDGQGEQS